MSENGEGTRRAVARDPLAELGEIELAGVLKRVRPGPGPGVSRAPSGDRAAGAGQTRAGGPALSGRPPLPGASVAGRTGTVRPPEHEAGPPRGPTPREPAPGRSPSVPPVVRETGPLPAQEEIHPVIPGGDGSARPLFEFLREPSRGTYAGPPRKGAREARDGIDAPPAASAWPSAPPDRDSAAGEQAAAPEDEDGFEEGARIIEPAPEGDETEPGYGAFIDGRSSVRFLSRSRGSRGQADPAEIERLYEEGKRHARAGRYAQAIDAYHDVLRCDPRHVRARNNLGFAYDCRGDYDLAINEYLAALELEPKNVQIHCNLGAVYGAKGRYDLAEEALRQATRLDPKSAEAHCNLGIVFCKKGMYHLATAELKRALELQSDYVHAHYYLGECYNHLDRHEEAIAEFEKALAGQPQNHKAYYNLGILYDKKNMPDRAMLMYRRAREIQIGAGGRPSGA
ncbi:MAG TPA: tetratricopeptide repeat protein [Gemmatimonadota bacterium]|jgi:tetratricopeptide (TPR) repeat protein